MATLKTVKECWPDRRLIVIFQPHRYTRTQTLLDRFAISFNDADILVVSSIFPAGETPIEGVNAERLAQAIKDHGHKEVIFCPGQEEIVPTLLGLVRPGDLVVTLGAGNIYRQGDRLFEKLGA
jgi:UDP-N-acetylmuramate--alanine ligase